jgi:hypothetical protein
MRPFALVIALLLLLGSCTGEPEPIEPTTSTSSSSKPAPPQLPESAEEETPSGAANFVSFWLDVSNYSARTGDTTPLEEISRGDCAGCDRYIDLYRSIYAKGGFIKGARRSISTIDLKVRDRDIVIRGKVRVSEGTYRNTKNSPQRTSKADVTEVEFAVVRMDRRWMMSQIGLATSDG